MEKVELLSPCGNFECVKAAVNNGADAVYLGGQSFSARAYADNFNLDELEKAVDYCHIFGVNVYVTVNTLYKNDEFAELIKYIDQLYLMGVDGLIMQDVGAIALVRKNWPDMPVHISTQLTCNSLDDVLAFEELGAKTVVLSRELNLEEIKYICDNSNVRIETFVHGALCVCYSGQCYMSSVVANRSGNRGKCAQNCRLEYDLLKDGAKVKSGHLLSTKDICLLEVLPQLLEAGVSSLKIEGRMKSAEYVAGVTAIYRKYLDLYYSREPYVVDKNDIRILQQLFNRGGFSQGYLNSLGGLNMMCPTHPKNWGAIAGEVIKYDRKKELVTFKSKVDLQAGDGIEIRTDDNGTGCYMNKSCLAGDEVTIKLAGDIRKGQKVYQTYDKDLMQSLQKTIEHNPRKVKLVGKIILEKDKKAVLILTDNSIYQKAEGDVVQLAKNQPLTREVIIEQISKMGNTVYQLDKLLVEKKGNVYLNKSSLNALRNEACDKFQKRVIESYKRFETKGSLPTFSSSQEVKEKKLTVKVNTYEQLKASLEVDAVDTIYLEFQKDLIERMNELVQLAHKNDKKIYASLPRIWRKHIIDRNQSLINTIFNSDVDGFLITTLGQYRMVKELNKEIHLDYTANVINDYSLHFWLDKGIDRVNVSIETSLDEINKLSDSDKVEAVGYGYLPLMVTQLSPITNFGSGEGNYQLKSKKDIYTLKNDEYICTIYSQKPLEAVSICEKMNVGYIRLNFLDEDYRQVQEIITRFINKEEKVNAFDIYNRELV